MTVVVEQAAPQTTPIADALRMAADTIEALPYARVTGQVTVLPALQAHAGSFAGFALDLLVAHLRSIGQDPVVLYRWSTPLATAQVAEWLRDAAGQAVES
ncbi:hypothetical protein [Streptosporangium jomthongense]|uniref:DUF4325 domain-containing protein n=1 Tax=Streptosporangium jomthongense TaxID=1193683 RepID=A0ABV8FDH4_9ACTN